jgi:hypothetical protein
MGHSRIDPPMQRLLIPRPSKPLRALIFFPRKLANPGPASQQPIFANPSPARLDRLLHIRDHPAPSPCKSVTEPATEHTRVY